jgi:hypothetical protein
MHKKRDENHTKIDGDLQSWVVKIWQSMIATLNQWLASFQFESRVKICLQKRKSIPLPPPINMGGFNALMEEKWEAKVEKKSSIFLVFFLFLVVGLGQQSCGPRIDPAKMARLGPARPNIKKCFWVVSWPTLAGLEPFQPNLDG